MPSPGHPGDGIRQCADTEKFDLEGQVIVGGGAEVIK